MRLTADFFKDRIVSLLKRILDFDREESYDIHKYSILKILLGLSTGLVLVAVIAMCLVAFRSNEVTDLQTAVNVLLFLILLGVLAMSGNQLVASKFLSLFYLFFAVVSMLSWGVAVPQALLLHIIAILIASILTDNLFTVFMLVSSLFSISGVFYLEEIGLVVPSTSWKMLPTELVDVFVYSFSIIFVFIISYLYNHEIKKAFGRLKKSESDLRVEKDSLEIKVKERTEELEKQHRDQMNQASRFIEFGKLSSGIFHDLANHLGVLMLTMDEKMSGSEEVTRAKEYLEEFHEAKSDFEKFLDSNKRRLKGAEKVVFNPDDEIRDVLGFMTYKAKKGNIVFEFLSDGDEKRICGSVVKFSHIVSNLVSNGINAYETVEREDNRRIVIKSFSKGGYYILEIFDFGCGIKEENKRRIFKNFFSTGKEGVGLGLGIVRSSVYEDFNGIVAFDSDQEIGTVFLVQIPLFEKKDD